MSFYEKMVELRKKDPNLSVKEMAAKVGCDVSTYYYHKKKENNKNNPAPKVQTLKVSKSNYQKVSVPVSTPNNMLAVFGTVEQIKAFAAEVMP